MNKTELTFNSIDFSKFDKIIFDSNSSLNSNYENKPMSQLLDDDFYFYIKKIKNIYIVYIKKIITIILFLIKVFLLLKMNMKNQLI